MAAGYVPSSPLSTLYSNTTAGTVASPDAVDGAIQAIVTTVNENYDAAQSTGNGLSTHKNTAVLDHPDQSVTTAKIKDVNVTTAKIADVAVTTAKLADVGVTRAKIANGAVGASQLDATLITGVATQAEFSQRAVNVKWYGAVGDGVTDDTTAILAALNKAHGYGETIYFPPGIYLLTQTEIDLMVGTFIKGAGAAQTMILVDAASSDYLFKTNLNTGIEDIRIKFVNQYQGTAILHNPGYISVQNPGQFLFERSIRLRNIEINFPFQNGYGAGLEIQVTNYDDSGTTYGSSIEPGLIYFYLDNLEVSYGNKCISIIADQKNTVTKQIWATATRFRRLRSNNCVYGIYFTLTNTASVAPLDFADINFSDVEIQCAPSNYFASTTEQTTAIYIKGIATRVIQSSFNDLTIWDSENGESGYLEYCNVRMYNVFLGYTPNIAAGFKQGFELVNSATNVDVDSDVKRHRTTNVTTGNVSEINYIDGGFQLKNTPDGANGYVARAQLREEIVPSTNYSRVWLEAYDKNDITESYIEMSRGIGFKGVDRGIVNIMARYTDGTMRSVVNAGSVGAIYNDISSEQGFFAGNGMYFSMQKNTVSVPTSAGYQTVNITIKEAYTFTPYLVSAAVELVDGGISSAEDVFIRQAAVTSATNVRLILKHTKASSISLAFVIVVCGYKTFTTTP